MKESEWTRIIIAETRKCNALVFAIVGSDGQEAGWPDRQLNHRYTGGVYLEFKGAKTRLADKQRIILRRLCERGMPAFVVRYPNRIESYDGGLLAEFDGTGLGLIKALSTFCTAIRSSNIKSSYT